MNDPEGRRPHPHRWSATPTRPRRRRRRRRRAPLGAALTLLLGAAGCRVHDVDPEPAPPVEIPEAFTRTGDASAPDRWWLSFDDPELVRLVERALAENLDLRAAWARLQQADAVWRQARAGLFPSLSLGAEAGRSRRTLAVGGPVGVVTPEADNYLLSIAASYEVDLWGRIASLSDAAELDRHATRDDVETLAMTLASRVAETRYALLEARSQRALLDDQLDVSRTFLDLVELRFAQGQASALDVYQQRQQVGAIEATVHPVEESIQLLEHQLAVLLGEPPTADGADGDGVASPDGSAQLPELPPLPEVVAPGDLLVRRPDLRSARRRAIAADHRLTAAIADLLPAIRLTAQTGYQTTEIANLFRSWMYNLAGNIAAPLFEGGRRRAEVERSRAVVTERLDQFGQTLLTAVREVEDALVQERKRRDFAAALDRQLEVARSSLREARTRYVNGLSDYLNVLASLSAYQELERSRLQAGREILVSRIQLHRALGGSWTGELSPPPRGEDAGGGGDAKEEGIAMNNGEAP